MSYEYWRGRVGYAPRSSLAVSAASQAVTDAETALQATLEREYPEGAAVYVIHHRGSFAGTVHSCTHYGTRVLVKNDRTGKVSKWWAAHVQLVNAEDARGVEGLK